jgi:hypothetical protein
MSRHRFTMKELKEFSDLHIIKCLVNERLNDSTNRYAPFPERLARISNRLDRIKSEDLDKLTERKS